MSIQTAPIKYDANVTVSVRNTETNQKIYRNFVIEYHSNARQDNSRIVQKILRKAIIDSPSVKDSVDPAKREGRE